MKKSTLSHSPRFNQPTLSIIFILIATVAISTSAVFFNRKIQESNPQTSQTINESFQKVIQPNIFFYSKSFGDLSKTFISLAYRFDGAPPIFWLSPQIKDSAPGIELLVSHPQLANLSWDFLTDDQYGYVLYQKNPNYKNLSDFINKPPSKNIAADPKAINQFKLPSSTISLENEFDLNQVDYILTTHAPSRSANNRFYYETIINLNNAKLNESGEIVWYAKAPTASENNPIYIGEIHVDYRN